MKTIIVLAIALLNASAFGQALTAGPLGASGTNIVLVSETHTEKAWERKVVMKRGDGQLINDEGQVGSGAQSAADGQAATQAGEIADASRVAMTNATRVLEEATKTAATNAIALAIVVPPETDRANLTSFVVKTTTDGTTDTQWVYFNRELVRPNRFVVYETFGKCSTNKATWVNWTSAGESVTVDGKTWSGCHKCTVVRPTWARGESCLTNPNEKLGGAHGFDFGDLLLTMRGAPLYTGYVTNGITGQVIYFDNGFYKGTKED